MLWGNLVTESPDKGIISETGQIDIAKLSYPTANKEVQPTAVFVLCYPITYMLTISPLNILSKGELNCCDWTSGLLKKKSSDRTQVQNRGL